MRWACAAEVVRRGDRAKCSVPVFFVDSLVQGITSDEMAVRVACEVVDPFGVCDVFMTVGRVDEPAVVSVDDQVSRALGLGAV